MRSKRTTYLYASHMLLFRLLLSQMEQVLDQYLEDDFKYLGIPYWHWSSHDSKTYTHDDDNTYPIFPDFWQDIKVAYKNPEHSSYDASFANDPDEDSGWGVHCTSDRPLDTIARHSALKLEKKYNFKHIFCYFKNGKKSIFAPEKSLKLPKMQF